MLMGEKIILRPIEEKDLSLLANWRNDPQNRQFFFTHFLINPGGQKKWYEALLANQNKVMYMVDTLDGKTVGSIGLDKIDWRNQECEGGPIVFEPSERSYGYAEEAITLMIKHVFEDLNLHRVYLHCFPFNKLIELLKWYGFKEEGVLRQSVFAHGKFHDKVLVALLREEWKNE
jgi:RimJ/RimL family protein N-acetyltransferase